MTTKNWRTIELILAWKDDEVVGASIVHPHTDASVSHFMAVEDAWAKGFLPLEFHKGLHVGNYAERAASAGIILERTTLDLGAA
jgi:hypothetical protein